jgi:hypothetical protein
MYLLKKNLIILIILIVTLFHSQVKAIDLTLSKPNPNDISRYWTMNKISPLTIDLAIEKFFSKKKLYPLEGIWIQNDGVKLAIVRESEFIYRKYIIHNSKNLELNGIIEGTYHRTKRMDEFAIFERFGGKKYDNEYFTAYGKLKLENSYKGNSKSPDYFKKLFEHLKYSNYAEAEIKSSEKFKNLSKSYYIRRIYP